MFTLGGRFFKFSSNSNNQYKVEDHGGANFTSLSELSEGLDLNAILKATENC